MTHYSDNPGHVRVDFFRTGGKWYTTEVIDMTKWWVGSRKTAEEQNTSSTSIHDAIKHAIDESGCKYKDMIAVVLEPYHEHAHPIMIFPDKY